MELYCPCDWLLSLGMFSRLIYIVWWLVLHFVLLVITFHFICITHFIFPLINPISNTWKIQYLCLLTNTCPLLKIIAILASMMSYLTVALIYKFLMNNDVWTSFHVFVGNSFISFEEMSIQILGPFLIGFFIFLLLHCRTFFDVFLI